MRGYIPASKQRATLQEDRMERLVVPDGRLFENARRRDQSGAMSHPRRILPFQEVPFETAIRHG